MHFVKPEMACLEQVYGDEFGRGTCAESEPLLMILPVIGICRYVVVSRTADVLTAWWSLSFEYPSCLACTEERCGEVYVDDTLKIGECEIFDRNRFRRDACILAEGTRTE